MQPATHAAPQRSLHEWVVHICESELPVFGHTARNIAHASREIETPTAELAEFILQDSSMTARVLKLANSVYYNPHATPINTVSRAIFLLGFDVVRTIALSIAIIDPLLKSTKHQHLLKELARSFHAAVQAKSLAQMRGMKDAEEIFIGALLYRIGHMAFWSFARDLAEAMDAAYREWDREADAETALLGFPLSQLSGALHKEWRLNDIVTEALSGGPRGDAATDITQAFELVMALEEGWGSVHTRDALRSIAARVDRPRDEVLETIKQNARIAASTAKEYGADQASSLIRLPPESQGGEEASRRTPEAGPHSMQLQMGVLRELSAMLSEGVDINALLGTVLEGIFRALAMDRTVLALISADRRRLQAKYVFGDDGERLKACFDFALDGEQHLFAHLLEQRRPGWYHSHAEAQLKAAMTPALRKCPGASEFYAMPLWIGKQGKGLIYADCKTSGRALNEQDFRTFVHFCEHANIGFELLTRQQGA